MSKHGNVVELGVDLPPPPQPSRPGRMHSIAIVGLVVSALAGLLATIALVSISWPEEASRVIVGIVALSTLSFLGWAAIAVFAAASDQTHVHGSSEGEGSGGD